MKTTNITPTLLLLGLTKDLEILTLLLNNKDVKPIKTSHIKESPLEAIKAVIELINK